MDSRSSSVNQQGQILIESLMLVILLSSLLIALGLFFQKSHKAVQRFQFQEHHHERKNSPLPQR